MSVQVEIVAILQDIVGKRPRIEPSTRIYEDLLIAGDDAAELLERIQKKFGTSYEGFRFEDFFPNESDALLCRIALLFGFGSRKTLTVQHLSDVVQAGKWMEPGRPVDRRDKPGDDVNI